MEDSLLEKPAPILKKFAIYGLNGYKDISLTCNAPVKIASADNGAGKTSLLTAIYSVLSGQIALLYGIEFSELEIIWGDDTTVRYSRKKLFGTLSPDALEKATASSFLDDWGSSSKEENIDLMTKFVLGDLDGVVQTGAYQRLHRESPFDRQEIFDHLSTIAEPLIQTGAFSELHNIAREKMGDTTLLYLPTYRRIEADIPEFRRKNSVSGFSSGNFKGREQRHGWDSTTLIYFGMADVEAKLNSIITQIRKETLEAYSRNSGQTLEQLIGNKLNHISDTAQTFDMASIGIVLARVGKDSEDLKDRLSEIIKNGEIYQENRAELRRFLTQLLRVYTERRDDERAIEDFVRVVNGYLCPDERENSAVVREKKLRFNKLKLELAVTNLVTQGDIKFNNLSSGEKQVVSIFARLMLDPRKKYFILVDEPELSLSIEWQQRLLPDICSAENFCQMIAITHSPFIFDNQLDVVSGPIKTSLNPRSHGV